LSDGAKPSIPSDSSHHIYSNSPRDLQQTWVTARAFQQHVAQQQAQQDAQHIPSRKRSETVEARGNSGLDASKGFRIRIPWNI
jgi:hypothetical protein